MDHWMSMFHKYIIELRSNFFFYCGRVPIVMYIKTGGHARAISSWCCEFQTVKLEQLMQCFGLKKRNVLGN